MRKPGGGEKKTAGRDDHLQLRVRERKDGRARVCLLKRR